MTMRRLHTGDRVRVAVCSGVNSGKSGAITDRREVRTDGRGTPVDVAGAYRPVNWRREVAVRLDDSTLITMFRNRLEHVS